MRGRPLKARRRHRRRFYTRQTPKAKRTQREIEYIEKTVLGLLFLSLRYLTCKELCELLFRRERRLKSADGGRVLRDAHLASRFAIDFAFYFFAKP